MTDYSNHVPAIGDIVKLKQPYKPSEMVHRKPKGWVGYEFGIIVEIVATQFVVNGDTYGNQEMPRNVSLHLYDREGILLIEPSFLKSGLCIPEYVDHHLSELELYKVATETGYAPVQNPPNWGQLWEQEKAVFQEFGVNLDGD